MVDDVTGKLKLHPIVLIEQRKKGVKFFLGKADNVRGGFSTKLFEVELGHGMKGFKGRLQGRWGQGLDDIGAGVNGAGLKGVWVDKGNTRISKGGRVNW